jgi:hypothetical protein
LQLEPVQLLNPARPIFPPKPIAVPAPTALPPPAPFVVLPDEQREQLERGELPDFTSKTRKLEATQDERAPQPDAPSTAESSKTDPAPIVVKPEPQASEREPEEAVSRRPKSSSKPTPSEAPKVYKRERDYCPDWTVPANWIYPPGKRPCDVIGSGGPGLSKGGRYDWVQCRYLCGSVHREQAFWGNSIEACLTPKNRPVY